MVVKVTGIRSLEEVKYCNILLPEYVTFIFYQDDCQVSFDDAKILINGLNPLIKKVASFKNQSLAMIVEIAKSNLINVIQLNGIEDDAFVEKVKKQTRLKVIKAFNPSLNSDYLIKMLSNNSIRNKTKNGRIFISDLDKPRLADALLANPFGIDLQTTVRDNGALSYYKLENVINTVRNCRCK